MYAVGRLGSYITRGVYTVSGPFHPFGGAVDIVVVQQQDGSLKSSPWYVRFGKFQGVLKGKEKHIDINVNGVDADFHMYLDQRGEAYFLQEIVPEDVVDAAFSPSSSGEEMDGRGTDRTRVKSKSLDCNYDRDESLSDFGSGRNLTRNNGKVLSRNNSKRSRILGFVLGRNSMKEGNSQNEEDDSNCGRTRSLERAEIAADLLEMKWSTNYSSNRSPNHQTENNTDASKDVGAINGGRLEAGLVLHEEHFVNNVVSTEVDNEMNSKMASEVDEVMEANVVHDVSGEVDEEHGGSSENCSNEPGMGVVTAEEPLTISSEMGVVSDEESLRNVLDGSNQPETRVVTAEEPLTILSEMEVVSNDESVRYMLDGSSEPEIGVVIAEEPLTILSESCTEATSIQQGNASAEVESESCTEAASIQQENASAEVESESCMEAASLQQENASAEMESESCTEAASIQQENASAEVESESCMEAASLQQENASAEVESESCTEAASIQQGNASTEMESCGVSVSDCNAEDAKSTAEVDEMNEVRLPLERHGELQDGPSDTRETRERSAEEQFMFSDLDDMNPSVNHIEQGTRSSGTSEVNQGSSEPMSPNNVSDSYPPRFDELSPAVDMDGLKRKVPSNVDIPRSCQGTEEELGRLAKSLPNMRSQFDEFDPTNLDGSLYYSLDSRPRNSKWDILRRDASKIIEAARENELPLSSLQDADTISEDAKEASIAGSDSSNIIDSGSGSWSLWPFRRSRSQKFSTTEQDGKKDSDADSRSETDGGKEVPSPKGNKTRKRTLTPTSEQLASLNLNEGKNTVTFTFSTSVLGPQQVDARIFLWRWDTRIVISDVDGTITKSDVLGQFMPLVGRDWSHIGVTHLFSAIKENGYQMLFLSARAISQAYITRQFLFNLNQDGKTLPEGPVVISPDGLFPSLFREVIRRCPHEFKIACLEDIKACFPPDWNPFYAGFGNRDTDEFSYLKVGIPKGKIFIINPKGEVVVNRCVDSKSYTSLHAMVNGIFPPISVHEEPVFS